MLFIVEVNIENLIASLEEASNALFEWFKSNRLKSNPDNFHTLVSTNKHYDIKIGDSSMDNNESGKLLGVKRDVYSNFNNHISHFSKRASRKISALARIAPFMNFDKRKLLTNAFFTSHFSCCPLLGICNLRKLAP